MLRFAYIFSLAAGVVAALTSFPHTAHACGGCFAPSGQPSVVTAHRMVVSLSDEETSLWDQFEYAGEPEDFVWVLPVTSGEGVEVAVAEQAFFQYLGERTQVTLQGPFASGGGGFGCSASDSYGPSASATNVTVYAREVVGPYESVVIGSDDVMSLTDWLADNGYVVPDALVPTIAHYVDQGMDFVALRLSPNAGVQQMQPVRVTTPGVNVTFPLRMVAAGVGATVALELYIIGEGRWEAASFPNAEVDADALVYDWATSTFNYDAVVSDLLTSNDGRTWVTEFASLVQEPHATAYVTHDETGYHGPATDWEIATRNLTRTTVTRMRAELPAEALGEDLVLRASELGQLPGYIVVENEINRAGSVTPPPFEVPVGPVALVVLTLVFAFRPRRLRVWAAGVAASRSAS